MLIDIEKIDLERFHVNERRVCDIDVLLIVPHKAMWDWNQGELHLRSLLTTPEGQILCAGFPKFFNYSEYAWNDKVVDKGLGAGDTVFTQKMDGSLIIRSIINGRVNLRTRGCHQVAEHMHEDVHRLVRDKYPDIMDPKVNWPLSSALFEYISPTNQIVVRYDEPQLVFLGESNWGMGELRFWPYTNWAEDRFSTPNVKMVELPSTMDEIRQMVSDFDDNEGVVAWTMTDDVSAHLCKFKSVWYLRLHALRSMSESPRCMKEFCFGAKVNTLQQLKSSLQREGFDWETVSYMEPLFEEINNDREDRRNRLSSMRSILEKARIPSLPTRKEKALECKRISDEHDPDLFSFMIAYVMNEGVKASELAAAFEWDMSVLKFKHFKERAKKGALKPSKAAMKGAMAG